MRPASGAGQAPKHRDGRDLLFAFGKSKPGHRIAGIVVQGYVKRGRVNEDAADQRRCRDLHDSFQNSGGWQCGLTGWFGAARVPGGGGGGTAWRVAGGRLGL